MPSIQLVSELAETVRADSGFGSTDCIDMLLPEDFNKSPQVLTPLICSFQRTSINHDLPCKFPLSAQCQEKECTFKNQSLLVLDTDSVDACPLPETIRSLMIVERTPKHWQLYVGSNFGSLPHMSIPTVFSEAIV